MAFNVPINSIAPIPTPSDWVRASDWPVITDTPNEVQYLVADTGAKAFTIRTTFTRTSGNIYIDWGDGVTDTISTITSTDTSHIYSTGGTPCSRGYNTFKIRIYGDATCVITNAQQISNFVVTGGGPYNTGVLEVYFGDNTCNTNALNSNYFYSNSGLVSQPNFQLLEYVKLPATVTWTNQFIFMFSGCSNLYKIIMPTSASSLINMAGAFTGNSNLLDITFPSNATGITNLSTTFQGCTNLRTAVFPTSLNSCTTLNSVLGNCSSLKNITLPSINLVRDLNGAFSGCNSLQWFRFSSLPSAAVSGTAVSCISMFSSCFNLQNVFFPTSGSSNIWHNMSNAFSNCYSLRNIIFPTGFNASTLNSCFLSNFSLTNVTFPASMSGLSNMQSCFSGCSLLTTVTLPTTIFGSFNISSMFLNCNSLTTITIPSTWPISTFANAFQGCQSLTSITLPNNAQNTANSMASMCNGCIKLETITMPTSLNAVTSLSSAFQNCSRLTSVVFPATMNSLSTMSSAFNGCSNLTSVTLPTSMSAAGTWTNAFTSCFVLPSLTMPTTVPVGANFGSLAQNCYNLKTLTLPTIQTTGQTLLSLMFTNCGSLTTINNLDKVGSLTASPVAAAIMVGTNGTGANMLTSLSFSCPLAILTLNGSSTTTNFNLLNSLRLLNASAGQWTGASPQINVSYCDLGVAALNQLFTDLTTVTAKTINITGCTGAAGCTRSIATAKGWTVTG